MSDPGGPEIPALTSDQLALIKRRREEALAKIRARQSYSSCTQPTKSEIATAPLGPQWMPTNLLRPQQLKRRRFNELGTLAANQSDNIKPAAVDYDLTKLVDTKGGFLLTQSDLVADKSSAAQKKVIYEHSLFPPVDHSVSLTQQQESSGDVGVVEIRCVHCNSPTLDSDMWLNYRALVCRACRDERPEEYSLLTKTEVKQDYLLTDEELRDTKRVPYWERPNPRKSSYARMKLYLRRQVEEFAFEKWGGPEGLDGEWERREDEKKERKDREFRKRMLEARKRTRTSLWQSREQERRDSQTHQHVFVVAEGGCDRQKCSVCGIELVVEEF